MSRGFLFPVFMLPESIPVVGREIPIQGETWPEALLDLPSIRDVLRGSMPPDTH